MKKIVIVVVVVVNEKEMVKAFSGLALLNEYVAKNNAKVKTAYVVELNK